MQMSEGMSVTIILGIIVASIFAVGMAQVYGETVTSLTLYDNLLTEL